MVEILLGKLLHVLFGFRYETIFLPIAAQLDTKDVAGPLDVQWIWHCHMLAPRYYIDDCMKLVGIVPKYHLLAPYHSGSANVRRLWKASLDQSHNCFI